MVRRGMPAAVATVEAACPVPRPRRLRLRVSRHDGGVGGRLGADDERYVLLDERDDDGAATVSIFALRHAGERGRRPLRGGGFRLRWDAPARKTSGPAESSPQQLVLQSL